MFGNLKKKLNNAIQEGLLQFLNTPTVNATNNDQGVPNEIATAGCSLLNKYENDWQEIHGNNEANAQSAVAITRQIEHIERRMQQERILMTKLNNCLAGLPELSQKLQISVQALQQVKLLTEIIEEKMERLQILCEECDLQEFMLQKHCELSQYKQKKMVELESHRQRIALEHEHSIKKHENNLRRIQSERQAVFEAAFRDDLEEYRQNGSIKSEIS